VTKVEALSELLHAIYQAEARRQSETGEDTVRHPDDYAALPEHIKQYDRVLAKFILGREKRLRERVEELEEVAELAWGIIANAGWGEWTRESGEWQEAAARWRDRYHQHRHVANPETKV
jgi:hypothetical protein